MWLKVFQQGGDSSNAPILITCCALTVLRSDENQCITEVRVVCDVCVFLQKFSGKLSGADTLPNKVLEHHGLSFATNNHENIEVLNMRYENVIKAQKAGRTNQTKEKKAQLN
jgi:hypothetical protein